ncbi:PaaI family thioesterase [Pedomonas mirosovicensis]|uniref:PaaI family thioesterase n=1 Tax=Pedomonas mirosovicensis TaxID=2908641 RepID=UPI0021672666|nr:PaaI family thioesterase [Pedomonas mirosovicensis]MCH8685264.1 PaaI family thioesterase [Pedomonas mirosovicensis]
MTVSPPSAHERTLHFDTEALSAFLDQAFSPKARGLLGAVELVELDHVRMRLDPRPSMLRPGGVVSGPAMMGLVDVAAYAVILAHIGPVAMAMTNTLTINFLRVCRMEPVYADARLLKLGRRLASVDVRLWQGSEDRLVAQATVGYALP